VRWLTDPYAFEFMQRALGAALLVGVLSPLVGVWIVLGRLAYLGDAMGHASLSGVALAYLVGASIVAGALLAGLVMAGLIALLSRHPRLRSDSVIGIAEVTLFAIGVLIISRASDVTVDLTHYLFGSITTVTSGDLRLNLALTLVAMALLAVMWRDLLASAFDPLHAGLVGVRVGTLRLAMLGALAIAVVVSLQSVGLLMSIAMLVIPAAAARLWTTTVLGMTALACALGVSAAAGGLTLAYHLATPPGATIALTAVALMAVSVLLTAPRRGRRPAAHTEAA
jgi:ABC-type Mn2+/Zn2+ transport system permease subunit